MAANAIALRPVQEHGWRMGLRNLLGREIGAWWQTRRWLKQALIWLFVINGVVALALFQAGNTPAGQPAVPIEDLRLMVVTIFVIFMSAPAIGAIIGMQDAIVEETRSGTAAWILSKPVSRAAFVVSKLLAGSLGFLVAGILIPGVVAYALLAIGLVGPLGAKELALGLALVALHTEFYLTLTLMLGTFFNGRGPVIGIPLALFLGSQFILNAVPSLATVLPAAIVLPAGGQAHSSLATQAVLGQPLAMVAPVIATLAWCALFVVVAVWRFRREEF